MTKKVKTVKPKKGAGKKEISEEKAKKAPKESDEATKTAAAVRSSKSSKKITTIEELAVSMKGGFKAVDEKMDRGFKEVHGSINQLAESTAKGFAEVHDKLDTTDKRVQDLDTRFTTIEKLNAVVARHDRTIDRLVDDMRLVKTALHLR